MGNPLTVSISLRNVIYWGLCSGSLEHFLLKIQPPEIPEHMYFQN